MAKLKPREILPRLDVGWNILWSVWYNLTSEQSAILQFVLSILAFGWTWGWGWPCFDTNLLPFQM